MRTIRSTSAFPARHSAWRGRSGRSYGLTPVGLAEFVLEPSALYLIAKGSHMLWVGSAEDIIADQASRARFRLALGCADRAFRLDAGSDDVERLTTIWDLESAEPEQTAAAA